MAHQRHPNLNNADPTASPLIPPDRSYSAGDNIMISTTKTTIQPQSQQQHQGSMQEQFLLDQDETKSTPPVIVESHTRSLVKGFTWRIVATSTTTISKFYSVCVIFLKFLVNFESIKYVMALQFFFL